MLSLFPSRTLRINFKWFILLTDILLSVLGFVLSNYILHEFYLSHAVVNLFSINLPFIIFARAIAYLIFETHVVSFRHVNIRDLLGVFISVLFGSVLIFLGYLVNIYTFKTSNNLSLSVLFTDFLSVFFLLTTYRLVIKGIFGKFSHHKIGSRNALIYGIDNNSIFIKKYVENHVPNLNILGFISDQGKNRGKIIEKIPIYTFSDLKSLKQLYDFNYLIGIKKNADYLQRVFSKNKRQKLGFKIISFPNEKLKLASYTKKTSMLTYEHIVREHHVN